MKKLIAVLIISGTIAVAYAQQSAIVVQSMTVAGTVTVFSTPVLAALSNSFARCKGILETAAIRLTVDGTTPSSTVGTPVAVGTEIEVFGLSNIQNFQSIRTTGTSGAIFWTCYQ